MMFFVCLAVDSRRTFIYSYIVRSAQFRWIDWNQEHATKHGCSIQEIESTVVGAGRGFPRKVGLGKWQIIGRGMGGRMIEVIYVLDDDGTVFVIHAMPLTTRRKRS